MTDILQLSESLRFPDQLADLRDAYMAMVETSVYYHQAGCPALAAAVLAGSHDVQVENHRAGNAADRRGGEL